MTFLANMHRILYVIVLTIFQGIWAQEVKVLDFETKDPIPNVAIYNLDKSKTALTDFNG